MKSALKAAEYFISRGRNHPPDAYRRTDGASAYLIVIPAADGNRAAVTAARQTGRRLEKSQF